MSKINKILLIFSVAIMLPATASAQIPNLEKVKSFFSVKNSCETINNRIDEKISKFNSINENNTNRISRLNSALAKVSENFKNKGQNTENLDSQINLFVSKSSEIILHQDNFVAKMTEAKSFSCGRDQNSFSLKLSEASKVQKDMVTSMKDIQNYAKSIRDEILLLKQESANKSTQTATSTNKNPA